MTWTCCGERASLNLLLQMQGRVHGCTAGAGPGIDEMYAGERLPGISNCTAS